MSNLVVAKEALAVAEAARDAHEERIREHEAEYNTMQIEFAGRLRAKFDEQEGLLKTKLTLLTEVHVAQEALRVAEMAERQADREETAVLVLNALTKLGALKEGRDPSIVRQALIRFQREQGIVDEPRVEPDSIGPKTKAALRFILQGG